MKRKDSEDTPQPGLLKVQVKLPGRIKRGLKTLAARQGMDLQKYLPWLIERELNTVFPGIEFPEDETDD